MTRHFCQATTSNLTASLSNRYQKTGPPPAHQTKPQVKPSHPTPQAPTLTGRPGNPQVRTPAGTPRQPRSPHTARPGTGPCPHLGRAKILAQCGSQGESPGGTPKAPHGPPAPQHGQGTSLPRSSPIPTPSPRSKSGVKTDKPCLHRANRANHDKPHQHRVMSDMSTTSAHPHPHPHSSWSKASGKHKTDKKVLTGAHSPTARMPCDLNHDNH